MWHLKSDHFVTKILMKKKYYDLKDTKKKQFDLTVFKKKFGYI